LRRSYFPIVIVLLILLPIVAIAQAPPGIYMNGIKSLKEFTGKFNGAWDGNNSPLIRGKPQTNVTISGMTTNSEQDSPPVVNKKRVVVDAGHGGNDPGSPGASMKDEKWYTLSMAQKVYALLQDSEWILPIMTRLEDEYISTQDRAIAANTIEADLFISIHANSYKNAKVRGTETYYYNDNSLPFAELMHEQILSATGFPDRKVKKMDYVVIKDTAMTSVLLEIGYLSHPNEEAAMLEESMMNRVAAAIVKGIEEYLQS